MFLNVSLLDDPKQPSITDIIAKTHVKVSLKKMKDSVTVKLSDSGDVALDNVQPKEQNLKGSPLVPCYICLFPHFDCFTFLLMN